jgi:hypothetical protein
MSATLSRRITIRLAKGGSSYCVSDSKGFRAYTTKRPQDMTAISRIVEYICAVDHTTVRKGTTLIHYFVD